MSAETQLNAALIAYAPLAAIVGQRIYPDALPEKCLYPAISYTREGTEPVLSIHGSAFGSFVTLSISAWAPTRTQADAAADAVEDALQAVGEQVIERTSGYDDTLNLYGAVQQVTLFID